jgi:hypothetical protein
MTSIVSVERQTGEIVETPTKEFIRYSADNWYVRMGESYEPMFDCSVMESEYQQFMERQS